jgi:hypothetical protein
MNKGSVIGEEPVFATAGFIGILCSALPTVFQ